MDQTTPSLPRSRSQSWLLGLAMILLLASVITLSFLPPEWRVAAGVTSIDLIVFILFVAGGVTLYRIGRSWGKEAGLVKRVAGLCVIIFGSLLLLAPVARIANIIEERPSSQKASVQFNQKEEQSSPTRTKAVISTALKERQEEIVRTVLRADGTLTQEMHREFWTPFRERIQDNAELQQISNTLMSEDLLSAIQKYQRAVWKSVKLSYENQEVVRLQAVDEMERELRTAYRDRPSEGIERAFSNTRTLLEAAAKRSPFKIEGKDEITLTMSTIDQVIEGLNASIARAQRLFDPNWQSGE